MEAQFTLCNNTQAVFYVPLFNKSDFGDLNSENLKFGNFREENRQFLRFSNDSEINNDAAFIFGVFLRNFDYQRVF